MAKPFIYVLRTIIPADVGYYVGYLITRAYYRNAKDKRQAVYDILNIQDARAFYEASGVRVKTVRDQRKFVSELV